MPTPASPLPITSTALAQAIQTLQTLSASGTPPDPVANPMACAMAGGIIDESGVGFAPIPGVDSAGAGLNPPQPALWETMQTSDQAKAVNGLLPALVAFAQVFGLVPVVNPPVVVTIPLAPITTNPGSLTFTNGILTAYVIPS